MVRSKDIKTWENTWGKIDWMKDSDETILNKIDLLKGEDPNVKGHAGHTPLILAAINGRAKVIEKLVDVGAYVDEKDVSFNGWTALIWAAHKGYNDVVQKLISLGSNPNLKNLWDYTPLMSASANGHVRTAEILIAAGADINAKDYYDRTPLMWAAINNHPDAIGMLFNYDADINSKDKSDKSAVMLAAERGHKEAVIKLIESQAELDVPVDWYERTKEIYPETIKLIDNPDKVIADLRKRMAEATLKVEKKDERTLMRKELQNLRQKQAELAEKLKTTTPERMKIVERLKKISNHELRRKIAKDIREGRIY